MLSISASWKFCCLVNTVKPVLDTCIKQPPDFRDHYSDTIPLLKSTKWNLNLTTTYCKRPLL